MRSRLTAVAGALLLTAGAAFAQQPPAQQPSDNSAQHGSPASHEFIQHLTVANMAEVQLGKLAAERAASPDVKAFGQTMVTDHTKAGNELSQIAAQLHVNPPTQIDQEHKALVDRLSNLRGAEFDREYINAMVQGHEKVARELKTRAGNRMTSAEPVAGDRPTPDPITGSSDPRAATRPAPGLPEAVGTSGVAGGSPEQALTSWAAKTLPTVEQHLQRAREIQQKVAR